MSMARSERPRPRAVADPYAPKAILRWEEPPTVLRGRRPCWIDPALEDFKARPGDWALVRIAKSKAEATHLTLSAKKSCRNRGLTVEVVSRSLKDGRPAIFARLVQE